ncbi:extracellular matrix protein 2 [Scomber japonicus]|uniref:extracellular matrix protein 2 n=1 Tax=Scomber japonicus TaxID=13676 RepID=UPI002304F741|nr:extracellular matrix protein 2 [Scomber japonicus]
MTLSFKPDVSSETDTRGGEEEFTPPTITITPSVQDAIFPTEENEDERFHMEVEEEREQQRIDFTKLVAGRQKRGAWGKRKHVPTVEAKAYRITTDTEINCRGIGMTQLPIIHNLEATKLDAAENNIQSITPDVFSGLPNLDTLDLSKNNLYDESFSQNPLSNLTFLKRLNLDGNQLTRIPSLPPSLEELKINNNQLNSLTPHCFEGLKNLWNLELQGNILHEASVSPETFRPIKKLLYLQLDHNRFRSLPQGLPSSLKRLDMNDNLIDEVTEEVVRDCFHLRALNLSHNLLHEQAVAHHAWTHLKALEVLDLSYNRFTSVPMNLPRRLSNLTLQHNDISQIPAFAFRHLQPGLQSLRLSHNSLSNEGAERVSFVGTYRSLVELLLDNNHLGEIPLSVRQYKKLQVLRLENNHIRLVRKWGVCHPRNPGSTLTSVHLENNLMEVERIPPNAFSCLADAGGLVLYPQQ